MKTKKNGRIKWLQISDLHIRTSSEQDMLLEDLMCIKDVDFLVVTGDLRAFGASYDITRILLHRLVDAFCIEKNDVFIVPGNHDVNKEKNKIREIALQYINDNVENNIDCSAAHRETLQHAFSEYSDFIEQFYGGARKAVKDVSLETWHGMLQLLCLNTALVSDANHDKKQIVDLLKFCEQEKPQRNCPLIVIAHHDIYCLHHDIKEQLKERLTRMNARVYLNGHTHRNAKDSIQLSDGRFINSFTGPKCAAESGDLWSDVGVVLYTCDTTTPDWLVTVETLEWSRTRLVPGHTFDNIKDGNYVPMTFSLREVPRVEDAHTYAKVISQTVPVKTDGRFVHRNDEIEKISNKVLNGQNLMLINGLGGVGKTAIARTLFYHLRENFETIAWIQYTNNLKESLLYSLALFLDIDDQELRYRRIVNELMTFNRSTLLFIDNLGKLTDEELSLLNGGTNATIIATSRLPEADGFESYPINFMSPEACVDIFYQYYLFDRDRQHEEIVYQLVETVRCHTLTVELLAKSANRPAYPLHEFLLKLKKVGFAYPDLFVRTSHREQEQTVAAHLKMLYDIVCFSPEQQHILKIFAILPGMEIPFHILDQIAFGINDLASLADAGWIIPSEQGYSMPDIVRESIKLQGELHPRNAKHSSFSFAMKII